MKRHRVSPPQPTHREASQKFLVLSTSLPYPIHSGGTMRSWAILTSLAHAGHRLSLLTLGSPAALDEHRGKLGEVFTRVDVVPHRTVNLTANPDYLRRVGALGFRIPYAALRFRSKELRRRLATLLARETYDAVISDSPYPLINFPFESRVPLIISEQNMEHVLLERYIQNERNALRKLYGVLEYRKLVRWQMEAWSRAALIMVCSDHDGSVLRNLCPSAAVTVVPNVIDVSRYRTSRLPHQGYLLYTGALDWYPNRDAVHYLLSEIFPKVKKEVPDASLVIAGRNPPPSLLKRYSEPDRVMFLDSIPDMRSVIAGAAALLVPIRIGSGTRIKILEAAALAKPIVSTSIGAEGLDVAGEREILIADTPERFAQSVVRLLRDADLQRRLGMAARRKVERRYGLDALAESLRKALENFRRRTAPHGVEASSNDSTSTDPVTHCSPASEAVNRA